MRAARSLTTGVRRFSTAAPKLPACDFQPAAYEGPSKEEVLALRKQHLNPALFMFYKEPLMVTDGHMQYLWDENGRRYLDLFAGIVTVSVGHCHPKVVEAGQKQMGKLMHTTTIYANPEIALYAKELTAKLPDHLNNVYFVNSGSEANDLAIMLARLHTRNYDVIVPRNAYHGMSPSTMGLTALHTWKFPVPQGSGFHHCLNPDPYRGPFGDDVEKYAWDVKNLIEHATPGAVAAFIAEPIQGVGGTIMLPDGYLREVYKTVRSFGGVCIADEVQTGFGRLGTHFWGFEHAGVSPDIVTMAKGIGNGAPLAAVVTTSEIAANLNKLHFNTYGGNPVSMALGRATLKVIEEENIQRRAGEVGGYFKQRLEQLQQKHDIIGDVRGKGLMLGVELVKDRKTKEPAPEETAQVFEEAKSMGLLLGKGGLYGNVFRIKPPMCLTREDVDFAIDVMDVSLSKL